MQLTAIPLPANIAEALLQATDIQKMYECKVVENFGQIVPECMLVDIEYYDIRSVLLMLAEAGNLLVPKFSMT